MIDDPYPRIATRAELEQRLSARATPEVARHLSPGPEERLEALRVSEGANERRIAALTATLDTSRENAASAYVFAALAGRPRSDFDRSR